MSDRTVGVALDGSAWAELRAARQPVLLTSAAASSANPGLRDDLARVLEVAPDSSVAVLPLPPGHGDLGLLLVAWDAEVDTLQVETMPGLTDYAQLAGLALLAGRAQRDRARMAMLDDRDRIARDMHDHVIQRLFATGLSLQSASRLSAHPGIQPRIEEAVDEIDAAIKEIRQAIDHLHRSVQGVSTGEELQALVASFAPGLGFAPALDVDGDIEIVGPGLRPDVLAVVREGCPTSRGTPAHSRRRCTSPSTRPGYAWRSLTTASAPTRVWPGGVWSTSRNALSRPPAASTCFPADHGGRCCAGGHRDEAEHRDVGPCSREGRRSDAVTYGTPRAYQGSGPFSLLSGASAWHQR